VGKNDADIALDEFGCDFGEPLRVSFGPAILDDDITALCPTKLS
jgi:hypothetical protein